MRTLLYVTPAVVVVLLSFDALLAQHRANVLERKLAVANAELLDTTDAYLRNGNVATVDRLIEDRIGDLEERATKAEIAAAWCESDAGNKGRLKLVR
jgi:hypothetical protein